MDNQISNRDYLLSAILTVIFVIFSNPVISDETTSDIGPLPAREINIRKPHLFMLRLHRRP